MEAFLVVTNSVSPLEIVERPAESYPLFYNNYTPSTKISSTLLFLEITPIIPQQETF